MYVVAKFIIYKKYNKMQFMFGNVSIICFKIGLCSFNVSRTKCCMLQQYLAPVRINCLDYLELFSDFDLDTNFIITVHLDYLHHHPFETAVITLFSSNKYIIYL